MQSGCEDTLEERYAIKFCFKLEKMLPQKRMECFRLLFGHLAWIEHEFLSGIRDSRKAGSLWEMVRGVRGVRKSIHQSWVPTGQTVNKEYYVEVSSDFRKRFLGKRPALFKSGHWHFQQDNAPIHNSIHPCHRLFDQDGHRQFFSLPIVQTLLPVIFAYSLSSRKNLEAVVMRQLRRWKRLWRRWLTRSHKRISMGPPRSCWNDTTIALQAEEITLNGTRVSCVYYQ